jgi:hypothetical protein
MGNKYQFKTKDSIKTFDTKNEFIEHCQARYKDSFNSRRTFGFYFSYDYGRNWYPIQDFKELRQTIQNEKKSEFFYSNSTKHTASSFNWIGSVVILFFIWIVLTILNDGVKKIDFVNNFNGFVFGWDSRFVRDSQLSDKNGEEEADINLFSNENNQEHEFLRTVQVTDYARQTYENSHFLNAVNITSEEKKWILGILSDPNPDPSGEAGNNCNRQNLRCEYCSNYIPSRLYTLQGIIKDKVGPLSPYNWIAKTYLNQKGDKGDNTQIQSEKRESESVEIDKPGDVRSALNNIDWEGALNDASTYQLNKGFDEIKSIIYMYKNDTRLECLHTPIDGKFCSERCSIEYKYSR